MTYEIEPLQSGFIGQIPVRNIWLLLLYASRLYRDLPDHRRVELEEAPDHIPNLVAEILSNAVERRLRRDLSQGYQRRAANLNRVRGRIDLFHTKRRRLLQRGRVACIFDELTVDTARNRYVNAALKHIAGMVGELAEQPDLEQRCRTLAFRLERAGVRGHLDLQSVDTDVEPDGVGWVDSQELQMLAAAKLALNLSIPTERTGLDLLPIVNRSETRGWQLYEDAVAGFYDVALSRHGWKVKQGGHIEWPAIERTPGLSAILPKMITDIVLERRAPSISSAGQRIVIDTKFTSIVGRSRFGKHTLKSGNMYQLYAYLRSQERPGDHMSRHSTGVLLYPSLGVDYEESAIFQGHRVSFATVDLAANSQTIRSQLLRIVDR